MVRTALMFLLVSVSLLGASGLAQQGSAQDDKILERGDKLLDEAKTAYEDARSKSSLSAFVDAGFKLEEARIKFIVLQEIGSPEKQKTAADRLRAINQLSKLIHDGKVAIGGTPAEPTPPKPAEAPRDPPKKDPSPDPAPVPEKPPVDVTKRAPVPDAAKQREAEKLIRDLFKDQYAKKTPADRKALARFLLDQAGKSQDDVVTQWVLYREAQDAAVQGCDVKMAIEAVESSSQVFDVDTLTMKNTALTSAGKIAKTPEECAELADALQNLIDELILADQYDPADKAATSAIQFARKANDAALLKRVTIRTREVAEAKTLYQAMKGVLEAQAKTPDDPNANMEIGRFLCFVKGSWDLGLRFIVKGSDATLKALAEKEVALPAQPADRVVVADGWYDLAEKEKSPLRKSQMLAHSKAIYESALPDANRLVRAKIERRLGELGKLESSSPGPSSTAAVGKDRLSLDLGGGVKMELIYIKPGVFTMGSTLAAEPSWQADERPEHRVTITKGFYLGKFKVTQTQWEAIMGTNPSKSKGPELPVDQVSWEDCQGFLKKLNEKAKNQLQGRMATLPTEAQWEYACRAGTKTRYWFGESDNALGEYAWFNGNAGGQTHPVGQKKPNPWGLFDMHGNVWDWCQDWAGPYGGDATDPTGPSAGDNRILRGGGWVDGLYCYRSAFRRRDVPSRRDANNGLRVAMP